MEDNDVLAILKIAFMLLFVSIVIIVGTVPFRVKKFRKNRFLRSMGTTFAGALFVNVSLVHILPESSDSIQAYLKEQTGADSVFPLANLLVMIGFLITIFFTRIIATHSHDHIFDSFSSSTSEVNIADFHEVPHPHHNEVPHTHQADHSDKKAVHLSINQTLLNDEQRDQMGEPQQGGENQEEEEGAQGTPQIQEEPPQKPQNHQDTYFLTLAMYFHTIFEGIAIGVQDTIGGFLSTAVAIALHKWADALSMGIQYRNRGIKRKVAFGLIIGQAILNAIAIGFGWAITSLGEFTEAIFLSISAGTFLAISTMEMLGQQLHRPSYRPQKFIILLLATGFISLVWFFQNSIFG